MAEAVVAFAVKRLEDLLISEAKLLNGVSDNIIEIQSELERMQCFLKEADKKQNQDKRVQNWVKEMRGLAFQTEDVIETFALELAINKPKSRFKEMLLRLACMLCKGISRHKFAIQLDAINAKLTKLTARLPTYGIIEGLEGNISNSQLDLRSQRISYSHDVEKDFVGKKKDIEQLIGRLKKENTGCKVVSICGMGGQGKTTLAQKLYNHAEIKAHFKAFAWVCITQQFDREKVLKGVLKQLLPRRKVEILTMNDAELVKELYNVQQETNCFIVIDDIWTIDSWRSLEPAFPVGESISGSKILLTTRNITVGEIDYIHEIQGLTEEEGWQLLSKKARINGFPDKRVASEMERIGRNMVKRCNGLPLAISSLGGILKGKLLREWEMINKDICFYLAKGGVNNDDEYYTMRHVLGLSYDSLPHGLKHCFLCFANYKEGEKIATAKLYMYWIAEGLISVEDKAQGEMMLDVAERYLDELAHRSLVQVETFQIEGTTWSKYSTCRIHDLIRDLCLSKVKEENVINVIDLQSEPNNEFQASIVRRLCIRSYGDDDKSRLKPYDEHVISHIRSLSVWKDTYSHGRGLWPNNNQSFKKFKLLRVMTASGYAFTKQNMKSISGLVYLKYLCLCDCRLKELPSSIGNLRNLETLDLRVRGYIRMPNVLWKLKQLQHLYLPHQFDLAGRFEKLRLEGLDELEVIYNYYMYSHKDKIIQLRKLKVFVATVNIEDNLTAENIINFIKSRELRYSNLEIEGEGVCCLINLLRCCFIDVLSIRTTINIFPKYDYTGFSRRLTQNCRIEEDPMDILEKLPNLRLLFMYDAYLGAELSCSANGFPQLQKLHLSALIGLRKWTVDEGDMSNL